MTDPHIQHSGSGPGTPSIAKKVAAASGNASRGFPAAGFAEKIPDAARELFLLR
jgi:hypothetical protein